MNQPQKVLYLQLSRDIPSTVEENVLSLAKHNCEVLPFKASESKRKQAGEEKPDDLTAFLESTRVDVAVVPLNPNDGPSKVWPLDLFGPAFDRFPIVALGTSEELTQPAIEAGADEFIPFTDGEACLHQAVFNALTRFKRWRQHQFTADQLRKMLEVDTEGWVIVDVGGQIRFANNIAQEILGQPMEELLGQNFGVPSGGQESMEIDIVRRTAHGPQTAILDVRVTNIEWNGEPAYLELFRDVTDYQQQIRETREAVRQRDQFLATLSHELRNPLAALSNAITVIGQGQLKPEQQNRTLEMMDQQCRAMTRLLDDLMDLSKVSQRTVSLTEELTPLETVVRYAVATAQPRVDAKQQRLEVINGECEAYCKVDRDRIGQVLINLLTNACKYTPEGGTLRLEVEEKANMVELRVADNGEGMPPSMLESVFEPFVQLRQTPGATEDGLGIGLALAKKITELHGGQLRAHSDGKGSGATFTLILPRVETSKEDTAPPEKAPQKEQKSEDSPLEIVLVEDRPEVRQTTAMLLQAMGHTVHEAQDGRAGLDLILKIKPDLALVDLGLPELSGHDVAKKVRKETGKELFLVALSGHGEERDKKLAAQAGFNEHVTKPVVLNALKQVVEQAREHQKTQASS